MKYLIYTIICFLFCSCAEQGSDNYLESHRQWEENRISRLKSKTGRLNLAGLYELKEGKNTIGSDSSNHIILPVRIEAGEKKIHFD